MVGGPPSHSAINRRWGPGRRARGSPEPPSTPPTVLNPNRSQRGRCQRREAPPPPLHLHRRAATTLGCPATANAPPPFDSTPPPGYRQALRWRAHLPPRRPMVCTPSPLSLSLNLLSCTSRYPRTHDLFKVQVDMLDLCLEILF